MFLGREMAMSTRKKYVWASLAICLAAAACVPSLYAQSGILRSLQFQGSSAFLGVSLRDVAEKDLPEYKLDSVQGVIVRSVVDGSPAEKAGIREDDVLWEFDGIRVRSSAQLSRLVQETPAGREVTVVIRRAGERRTMPVRLEEATIGRRAENQLDLLAPLFGPGNRGFNFDTPDSPGGNPVPRRGSPSLGVTIQPLSEQLAEYLGVPQGKGLLVASVDKGSPSFGKLKAGDVIIRADGKDVATREDLADLVRRADGGSIALKVIRDTKEISITVDLAAEGGRGFRL